jgi:hypothetical protein
MLVVWILAGWLLAVILICLFIASAALGDATTRLGLRGLQVRRSSDELQPHVPRRIPERRGLMGQSR